MIGAFVCSVLKMIYTRTRIRKCRALAHVHVRIFSFVDKNGDGKLTRKELLIGLKKSPAVAWLDRLE